MLARNALVLDRPDILESGRSGEFEVTGFDRIARVDSQDSVHEVGVVAGGGESDGTGDGHAYGHPASSRRAAT